MLKPLLQFSILLVIITSLIGGVHLLALSMLNLPLFEKMMLEAYVFNVVLAINTVAILILLQNNYASALGFIFMASSLVKFGLFFVLFYPSYKADGTISSLEFSSFFVPYAFCLISEVIYLSRTLNKS